MAGNSPEYDVIVIGAGHNGLTCAAYLARAGRRVLVLERRQTLGGAAATEEVFPGFRFDTGAADAGVLRPEVVDELNLEAHGLKVLFGPVRCASLLGRNEALVFWRDVERTQAELRRYSSADAGRYPAFLGKLARLSRSLEGALGLTPPALPPTLSNLLTWARVAARIRRLGRTDMMDLLRSMPNSAEAVLDDWFESGALKGALASLAVSGSPRGPRAHGSAFLLLYFGTAGLPRSGQFVRGGSGELSNALAGSAQAHGAGIRTGQAVERILLDDGRAVGVQLPGGAQIRAAAVASSASPRSSLLELIPPASLEVRVVRRARNIRFRGSTARVNLALARLPEIPAISDPSGLTGHLIVSPDPDYLERAADDAKYGRYSTRPYLDMTIPTLLDPARAPDGQHILTITMQYAPYALRDTDWDSERERLADRIVATIAEFAPELPGTILHRQVLTPLDYEREYGLSEGCIYHGEMGLDQLASMRPIPGYGSYRGPVAGLFFCGAGAHPGGGVSGAPGRNAARVILRALRRRTRLAWNPTAA